MSDDQRRCTRGPSLRHTTSTPPIVVQQIPFQSFLDTKAAKIARILSVARAISAVLDNGKSRCSAEAQVASARLSNSNENSELPLSHETPRSLRRSFCKPKEEHQQDVSITQAVGPISRRSKIERSCVLESPGNTSKLHTCILCVPHLKMCLKRSDCALSILSHTRRGLLQSARNSLVQLFLLSCKRKSPQMSFGHVRHLFSRSGR